MGPGHDSFKAVRCPWATALGDPRVGRWLSTFWAIKELGSWPPGRQDPQLLSACAVIASEHAKISREEMEKAQGGG